MAAKTVEMVVPDDGVKGKVVKYEAIDQEKGLIKNLYLSKGFAEKMPQKIFVTVSDEAPAEPKKKEPKNAS
jgi:hypothetical protein